LFDPKNYLGASGDWIDRVIDASRVPATRK
jgi:hypothetical protein